MIINQLLKNVSNPRKELLCYARPIKGENINTLMHQRIFESTKSTKRNRKTNFPSTKSTNLFSCTLMHLIASISIGNFKVYKKSYFTNCKNCCLIRIVIINVWQYKIRIKDERMVLLGILLPKIAWDLICICCIFTSSRHFVHLLPQINIIYL